MSFPESHDDSPSTAPPPAFYVDPQTLSGLPLSQIVARVGMLEVALRESEDRLRLLVDAVTEYAIFTLDRNGIIESWNTGAERMKGYTHDEALGRHFSMLYPAEARQVDLPQDLLDMARATGSREHSGWQVNKDGATFWSDVVISSMLDDRGNHTGYVIVIRDRTESHRLEVAKDTFYSVFRHDFRMPITAIQGFAELLRDVDHQDQERFVDRIETNAQRLLTMVEGLIDYARLRSGEVPIALQSVDMAALARRALADLGESTDTSRVTFRGPPSVRVLADPAALEGVVASLLTSALQHSPAGSEITIVCEQVQDAGILTIADQGGGADRGDLRSIFVEFDDANLAHADASASGLGLASVQHHIDLQGGTVDRTSQLDAGTVVRVRLPSAPDAGVMAPEAPQRPPLVRPRPPGDDAPPAVDRERSGSGGRAGLPRVSGHRRGTHQSRRWPRCSRRRTGSRTTRCLSCSRSTAGNSGRIGWSPISLTCNSTPWLPSSTRARLIERATTTCSASTALWQVGRTSTSRSWRRAWAWTRVRCRRACRSGCRWPTGLNGWGCWR